MPLYATPALGTAARTVQTVAGSYGEGLATDVPGAFSRMAVHNNTLYTLPEPINIVSDPAAEFGYVKAINLSTGRERVIAGTGDGGDHGPALTARLVALSIAAAPDGTIYVGEPTDIRKIDKSGTITTVARIRGLGVAADSAGDVFAVDGQSAYEISPNGATKTLLTVSAGVLDQIVVTPAGDVYALNDGYDVEHVAGPGPKYGCGPWNPRDIAVGPDGDLYGIDFDTSMLQRCDYATGHIADVRAVPRFPTYLAIDSAGNAYVTTKPSTHVERIAPNGTTTVVAGNGTTDFMKAGGAAKKQVLTRPFWTVAEPHGGLLYAGQDGIPPTSVRRITPDGIVHNFFPADRVYRDYAGAAGVAPDGTGGIYAADSQSIYHQDHAGHITALIRNAPAGYTGDGGPSKAASVSSIFGIARDRGGDLFFADSGNNALRYIKPDRTIHTLTSALRQPLGVVVAPSGRIYTENDNGARVTAVSHKGHRKLLAGGGGTVCPTSWIPGSQLSLRGNGGMAVDSAGNLFVSDWSCIVKVTPDGNARTIAGFAAQMYVPCHSHGDGEARLATCIRPSGLTVDAAGDVLFIDDNTPPRIRSLAGAAAAGFPRPGDPWATG